MPEEPLKVASLFRDLTLSCDKEVEDTCPKRAGPTVGDGPGAGWVNWWREFLLYAMQAY